jgi:regulation of enolase protein 1 (concanavalin A-like superfamily)
MAFEAPGIIPTKSHITHFLCLVEESSKPDFWQFSFFGFSCFFFERRTKNAQRHH